MAARLLGFDPVDARRRLQALGAAIQAFPPERQTRVPRELLDAEHGRLNTTDDDHHPIPGACVVVALENTHDTRLQLVEVHRRARSRSMSRRTSGDTMGPRRRGRVAHDGVAVAFGLLLLRPSEHLTPRDDTCALDDEQARRSRLLLRDEWSGLQPPR